MNNLESSLVEEPAIEIFKNELGWETINAFDEFESGKSFLAREEKNEVILLERLKDSLKKINPTIPEEPIIDAIREFTRDRSNMGVFKANKEVYEYLKEGVTVKFNKEDKEVTDKVFFIDWNNINKNNFLIVNQFWITGDYHTRRPDLILFVNGIPLVLVEFKNPSEDVKSGFDDNITDYKDTIPQLFIYNSFIIVSNGTESKIGSTFAGWEHFTDWKKINSEGEKGTISLDTLIKGTCEKNRLLNLIENFILFTKVENNDVKIISKNHQFLGVQNAIESLNKAGDKNKKLGVFWHTQGSGKSISMMFLTQKILRKKEGDWTFIVVTDRKELDQQIYKSFLDSGIVKEKQAHAETCNDLKKLLSENHRFIFTLIHKFRDETNLVSQRKNIIVIVDEAHRTQYDTLALNMRNTLPHASFLAFTGTPLISTEQKTKEVFGEYISKYDFKQSIDDKATVPLFYENRIPELQISNENINREIEEIIEASDLDEDEIKKLEKKFINTYKLITDEDRLEKISKDIVEHFVSRGNTGKAMIICIDKATAIKMFNKVSKHFDEYLKKLEEEKNREKNIQRKKKLAEKLIFLKETDKAVVVSQSQNEIKDMKDKQLDILVHRDRMNKEDLDTNFKNPDHPLRLVFVCSMWLTGFDVPSCSTLYLDKPMKNHTLMQALARANRVHREKSNGLIIDYIGVFKNLQKALSIYGKSDVGDSPIVDKSLLMKNFEKKFNELRIFLSNKKIDFDLIEKSDGFKKIKLIDDAVNEIVIKEKDKNHYNNLSNNLWKIYKSILPYPEIKNFQSKIMIMKVISKKIKLLNPTINIDETMSRIDQILEDAIIASEFIIKEKNDQDKYIDLSSIDFERLKEKFNKHKNTEAEILKNSLKMKVEKMIKLNPTRMNYQLKLQDIIDKYNSNSLNVEEFFKSLIEFVKELNTEETRHITENLNPEELSIFDILNKPEVTKKDSEVEKIKKISKELLLKLKSEKFTLDWQKKQMSRAKVKVTIKDQLENLPSCFSDIYEAKCQKVYSYLYENYN